VGEVTAQESRVKLTGDFNIVYVFGVACQQLLIFQARNWFTEIFSSHSITSLHFF
jgi:uncharacterized membrane protein